MADNVTFQSSTPATPPASTVVSTEEVTTLNGSSVSAQQLQRIVLALRTADATAKDVTPGQASRANSMPVALSSEDAALLDGLETALAALGTEATLALILAKLIAAPATEAKQDTGNTSLASLVTQTDGIEGSLSSILAKIIAAPSTEAKQDSAIALLTTIAGYLDGVETNQGTGNTSLASLVTLLTTQAGYLDGIEGLLGRLPSGGAATEATLALLKAVFPTTLDTNSGNKSASTLRVVLATDQPNLTSALNVSSAAAASELHLGEVGGNLAMITTAFTRPADTTAYAANDAVGDSTSAITMQALANAARVSGGSGYITGIRINTDKKSITPRLRIHFYNTNGATLSNDNAAWQDRYADNSKYVGCWDLPAMRTGGDSTNSTNSYSEDLNIRIPYTCAATSLYYVLETLDAFTPASGQAIAVSVFVDRN